MTAIKMNNKNTNRRSRPLEFTDTNCSEIARKCKVSVSHVSRILRGERRPSTPVLVALGRALHTPIGKLVKILKLE